MFGVTRSEPKQLKWENPRSSMRITTMLGASSPGCVGVGHHGTDSATVLADRSFKVLVLLHRLPLRPDFTLDPEARSITPND